MSSITCEKCGQDWLVAHECPKDKPINAEQLVRCCVARAICAACNEDPDHVGDARGNEFRWQDYLDVADAAIDACEKGT